MRIFLWLILWIFIIHQSYAVYIDIYNFRKLEQVKSVLNKPENLIEFSGLKDFNNKFKQDIQPIKWCYVISKDNGNEPYIFWFKLESLIYIHIYGDKTDKNFYNKEYFSYPSYDIPEEIFCTWICYDFVRTHFEGLISRSCDSKYSKWSRELFWE